MPGIADNQVQQINTAPIAAIGSETPATPVLKDFMDAFRSGFITVDDLTRRTKQSQIDTSNLKTTLTANDLQRRQYGAQAELLPGQQRESAVQQRIQESTAPGRLAEAGIQNEASLEKAREFAEYQKDPQAFIAKKTDQQLERTYIENAGPLPAILYAKNPEKPISYDEWLNVRNGANAEAGLFFSGQVSDDPKTLNAEYQDYKRSMEMVPVKRGTPEYAQALRKEVNTMREKSVIQDARAKALVKIIENQAGGGSPPHVSTVKRINAAGKEEEVSIATDPRTGEVVSETVLAANSPKLTEVQSNAQLFATRMGQNDITLTKLEGLGFNPAAFSTTAQKFLPNRLRTDEVQAYTAAKDNWISAVLRKESGAAISANEYKQANKEYFPQDGDSAAVVKQKQALRKVAEQQIRSISPLPSTAASTPSVGAGAPSAGTKRVIQNGVTFEWNGSQYVPLPVQ